MNTILWGNVAPKGRQISLNNEASPRPFEIRYSDVMGGEAAVFMDPAWTIDWGDGMIDADPRFVDSMESDFHLTHPSPCRDAGCLTPVNINHDFEDDFRLSGGAIDIGADEFHPHFYVKGDKWPGGILECNVVGYPGELFSGIFLGSGKLAQPASTRYGPWFLDPPAVFVEMPGRIPFNGILTFPATIQTALIPTYFMQAFIDKKLSNLYVLEVEL